MLLVSRSVFLFVKLFFEELSHLGEVSIGGGESMATILGICLQERLSCVPPPSPCTCILTALVRLSTDDSGTLYPDKWSSDFQDDTPRHHPKMSRSQG